MLFLGFKFPCKLSLKEFFSSLSLIENIFKNFFLFFAKIRQSKFKSGNSSSKFKAPLHLNELSFIFKVFGNSKFHNQCQHQELTHQ